MTNSTRRPAGDWDIEPTVAGVTVLMLADIRRELQKLNRVFECGNFLEIPSILRTIKRNTTKKRHTKKQEKSK